MEWDQVHLKIGYKKIWIKINKVEDNNNKIKIIRSVLEKIVNLFVQEL